MSGVLSGSVLTSRFLVFLNRSALVSCHFETTNIAFLRCDYASLQEVISIHWSIGPSVRLSVHPSASPSQVIFKHRKSSFLSVGNLPVINDNVTLTDDGVVTRYVTRGSYLGRRVVIIDVGIYLHLFPK